MQIPLPPLAEQRRIVARVDAVAERIAEARRLRVESAIELDACFQSERRECFHRAAQNGVVKLESKVKIERGRFLHRPRNEPRFFNGKHPWIQIGEIERSAKYITEWSESLNDEGLRISRKFPIGTVLVSIAATIGAVGILTFDYCVPDSVVALTSTPECDAEFLYYWIGYIRSDLERIAPQSAQKNINLHILSDLPIPNVSLTEQRRIVAHLDSLQAKADALRSLQSETAADLDALLPAVLAKAFAGEL